MTVMVQCVRLARLLCIVGMSILFASSGNLYADIVFVDTFETSNSGVASSDGLVNGSHFAAEALGEGRGLDVFNEVGGTGTTSVEISGGTLNFLNDPNEFGSLEIIYEREAGAGLFVDLTGGGSNDIFSFDVVASTFSDLSFGLEIVDADGLVHRETISGVMSGQTGFISLLPFSSLELENARSVEFVIEDQGTGGIVSVDNLQFASIPEPQLSWLWAALGMILSRQRRRSWKILSAGDPQISI